jgi:uncharacterized lipoprotein YajG
MDAVKSLQKLIGIALAIVFLAGCAAPAATPNTGSSGQGLRRSASSAFSESTW